MDMNVTPVGLHNDSAFERRWYQPHARAARVQDISLTQLQALGVRAVLLDLDDTLLPMGSSSIAPEVVAWVRQLQAAELSLLLLSNGTKARVQRSAAQLGVDGMALAGKPAAWAFWRGLQRLGYPAQQVVMIGDQLFTDVIGANLMNITSILVCPLSEGSWHTKQLRYLETQILKRKS